MGPKKLIPIKTDVPKNTRPKILKYVKEDILDNEDFKTTDFILENLTINHPKYPDFKFTKDEIFNLMSIKYKNFPNVFVLANNDLLYEIIAYCLEYGYEKCYNLVIQFANSPTILDSKIILQTEFFTEQKETQRENAEKLKTKITIADSIATCPECRSKKIFTVGTQSRGGDEGLTYNYTCQNCNWVWKKNS